MNMEHFLMRRIPFAYDEPVRAAIIESMIAELPSSAKVRYSGYQLPDPTPPVSDEWVIIYTTTTQGETK